MRVFFDNCTSPVLASTLHGFASSANHTAVHIKDADCGRHATDMEWIAMLASDATHRWVVVTGDIRLSKNKAERAAFRSAGLFRFVLRSAYAKLHSIR